MSAPVDAASPAVRWLACLAAHGYRLTAPRQAVVEVIAASQHVLEPQSIFEIARRRYPRLGLVTVYRTLEKLEELNLIQRVHQPQGCQAFVAAADGHQHLLICQRCGRVAYFSGDDEIVDELSARVSQRSGYAIREHWLQFFGLCAACAG